MNNQTITKLYNNLVGWESKRVRNAYPIHKRLNQTDFGYKDIYHWLAANYSLPKNANILDAGCGVGFGSIYLSHKLDVNVTGIGLSNIEIDKAKEFAAQEKVENRVQFKQQSFDDLPKNTFDLIVAIESVKHTLESQKSIQSLKNALKPNGTLVVIDDFLIPTPNQDKILGKYARDWALKEILTLKNFQERGFVIKKDFTDFVLVKKPMRLNIGIFILSVLQFFSPIAKIMRGGLYLELLFQKNTMRYYAMEYKKNNTK